MFYTNKRNKEGGFGVSKLIFNRLGGWNRPVIDLKGEYGVSQNMFAIIFSSPQDAKDAYKFFRDPKVLAMFQDDFTWTTSMPASFWKMFRNMKDGFWHQG